MNPNFNNEWTTLSNVTDFQDVQYEGNIVLTIGNYGYRHMISNLLWNLELKTNLLHQTVVFSYDRDLIVYLKQQHPTVFVYYLPFDMVSDFNFKDAVAFKEQNWDALTLYKLYAIWYLLSNTKYNVYYTDSDIYYIKSVMNYIKMNSGEYEMMIQEGVPYCSGMIYAKNNEFNLNLFNPKSWRECNTDDENFIKQYVAENKLQKKVGLFPKETFPNGLIWRKRKEEVKKQLRLKKYYLIHFNYIKGIDKKKDKMKEFGMWINPLQIVDVPKMFQPDLNDIVKQKRQGHTFPPHQDDKPQIEPYFHNYLVQKQKEKLILSNYQYLPVYWTAIAVKGDKELKIELEKWINKLMRKNKTQQYFTVVQHCKGIRESCGITLDLKRVKIIGTSLQTASSVKSKKFRSKGKTTHINQEEQKKENLHLVIPLLCSPHTITQNIPREKSILASFIGNLKNHPIRMNMERMFRDKADVIVEQGDYKNPDNQKRFEYLMSNSIFALCPRGVGTSSYRLIEAMQYGCIPVYISNTFSLPFPKEIEWKDCCVLIKNTDLPSLYMKLKSINPRVIATYQQRVKDTYQKYLTIEKTCENMLKYIPK